MKFIVALLVILVCAVSAKHGTYRECDINTGDETFLEIGPSPDFETRMSFFFGGCLNGAVQYRIDAEFKLEFVGDRSDGGEDVTYTYRTATATPFSDDAVNALSNTCQGQSFQKNVQTDVLDCLFCPIRYDIYLTLEEGIFVLGDGIACNEADRPTQYEESKYVIVTPSPSVTPTRNPSPTRTPNTGNTPTRTPNTGNTPTRTPNAGNTPTRTPNSNIQTATRTPTNNDNSFSTDTDTSFSSQGSPFSFTSFTSTGNSNTNSRRTSRDSSSSSSPAEKLLPFIGFALMILCALI